MQIRVVSSAERQISAASRWWRRNRPAAPELLRDELERAFLLLTTHPAIGTPARDVGLKGVRRLHLYRIRYYIYYRLRDENTVDILAFWHTSRGRVPEIENAD